MIKFLKPSEIEKPGSFILIYGPPDVGKTHNTLLTLPRPILFIMGESKGDNMGIIKNKIGLTDDEITCVPYDEDTHANELLDLLFDSKLCAPFRSVFADGFTHLMSTKLHTEVEDQHFKQKDDDKKVSFKTLAAMTKTNVENHGVVNNLTKRIFTAMGNRSVEGKVCVIATHYDEQVKWGGEFVGGPSFSGKQISKEFVGYFDYVGKVADRFEYKDGQLVLDKNNFPVKMYPPLVYFQSDGTFIARGGKVGPLNFCKMLGAELTIAKKG